MTRAFPGTMQSYSIGITCFIGVSHRKAMGNVAILERRFNSDRMHLVILNFFFEFHTMLWAFDN